MASYYVQYQKRQQYKFIMGISGNHLSHWIESATVTPNILERLDKNASPFETCLVEYCASQRGVGFRNRYTRYSFLFCVCMELVPLLSRQDDYVGDTATEMGENTDGSAPDKETSLRMEVHPIYSSILPACFHGNGPNSLFHSRMGGNRLAHKHGMNVSISDSYADTVKIRMVQVEDAYDIGSIVHVQISVVCIIKPKIRLHGVAGAHNDGATVDVAVLDEDNIKNSVTAADLKVLSECVRGELEGRIVFPETLLVLESACSSPLSTMLQPLAKASSMHEVRCEKGNLGGLLNHPVDEVSSYLVLQVKHVSVGDGDDDINVADKFTAERHDRGYRLGKAKSIDVSLDCNSSVSINASLAMPRIRTKTLSFFQKIEKPIGYDDLFMELSYLAGLRCRNAAPSAVLLAGCSGVGKTKMATCLATDLSKQLPNAIVHIVSINDLLEHDFSLGVTDHLVEPFLASVYTHPVLIIDDLDVLCYQGEGEGSENENVATRTAIAAAIDLLIRKTSLPFILGICRDEKLMPSDLLRVGRFEKVVSMFPPTQSQRSTIIRHLLEVVIAHDEKTPASDNDLLSKWTNALVPRTPGFTFSDLQKIRDDALIRASSRSMNTLASQSHLRHSEPLIHWQDIETAVKGVPPSQLELLDVTVPSVSPDGDDWKQFAGYHDIKSKLQRAVVNPWLRSVAANAEAREENKNSISDEPSKLTVPPPPGVIFHGPPGVGKTRAAHCLAASLGLCVIQVRASDVLDKWLGGSEAVIRSIFSRARSAAPCILFFDDIDALASNRESDYGSDVHSRILSTLLNEMDGVSSDEKNREVLVISATNRLDAIDSALLRPGRLQEHFQIPYPNVDDCRDILTFYTHKMPLESSLSLDELAERLSKIKASGADIQRICRDACLSAIREADPNQEEIIVSSIHFARAASSVKL